jgi:hypothetical protein
MTGPRPAGRSVGLNRPLHQVPSRVGMARVRGRVPHSTTPAVFKGEGSCIPCDQARGRQSERTGARWPDAAEPGPGERAKPTRRRSDPKPGGRRSWSRSPSTCGWWGGDRRMGPSPSGVSGCPGTSGNERSAL